MATNTNGQKIASLQQENAHLQQRIAELEQQRDIAERQQMEEDLQMTKFSLDHAADCVHWLDGNGKQIYVNHAVSRLLGYTREELLTMSVPDLDPNFPMDQWPAIWEENRRQGVLHFETQQRHKDGHMIPLEVKSQFMEFNGKEYICSFFRDITERKRTEEELHTFKALIENAPDGVAIASAEGNITYANAAYQQMYGYGNDIYGIPMVNMVAPEEQPRLEAIGEAITANGEWQGTLTSCRKDGQRFAVQASTFLMYDEAGNIRSTAAIARDITEQQQAERTLHIFKALAENAPDMIGIADMDGRITYLNPSYQRGIGLDSYTAGAMFISDTLAPHEQARLTSEVIPAIMQRTSWNGTLMFRTVDGATFPVQSTGFLVKDDHGQPVAIASISHDITAQQQAERTLQTFRTLIENAPDSVGIANLDAQITYANPAFREQLQITEADLEQGLTIPDIVAPNEREQHISIVGEHVIGQGRWAGEVTYQRKDGSTFPSSISGFLVRDTDGQPIAVAAIIRDITEQKQRAEDMQRLVTLIENSPDFIGMANMDGSASYLNTAGRRLVGIETVEEFEQTQIIEYFVPEERERILRDVIPVVLAEGKWQGDCTFQHFKTGQPIPVSWNVFLITSRETGEPVSMATVTRDLTERQQAEEERAALQQQVIDAQRDALRELSTPLIPISEDVVIMPLIGTIDSGRAQMVMETLLEGVGQQRASLAILDITGVPMVDTQVAQALVAAAQAVKLLGAQVMLTGIKPQVAQTLVHLGVDLSGIVTRGSLQSGIISALQRHTR
jgi:rsbT co-antagonist protein RsbR